MKKRKYFFVFLFLIVIGILASCSLGDLIEKNPNDDVNEPNEPDDSLKYETKYIIYTKAVLTGYTGT